ncbi:MAG: cytochrome c biogenesis protein CcdA [Chloroflexi bacterium]|nr:cytochrome c biogenesis protein CcdA [Chloroflexota bacterium]
MEQVESQSRKISTRILVVGGALVILGVLLLLALTTRGTGASAEGGINGGNFLVLIPASFLAGLLSFLSPCTLPILPAYFAFGFQARKQSIVLMTVAFFLGLATTMTILGATATALTGLIFENLQQITFLGGLVVIAFGIMSLLGKGFTGIQVQERPSATVVGSYVYGATFALGWTACVGPILGALLTLLATQGMAILQGAVLAFIYALGLGTPLILISTFFSRLGTGSRFWKIMRGKGFIVEIGPLTLYLHSTSILSGLLLIVIGYLLASGKLTTISRLTAGSDVSQWILGIEEYIRAFFRVQ